MFCCCWAGKYLAQWLDAVWDAKILQTGLNPGSTLDFSFLLLRILGSNSTGSGRWVSVTHLGDLD